MLFGWMRNTNHSDKNTYIDHSSHRSCFDIHKFLLIKLDTN